MYNHKEIEAKWQAYWDENKTFKVDNPPLTPPSNQGGEQKVKPKYYCLDMFPFPSGAGLHVGHPEGYTANDILARYKTAKGFNVLHPMGWDAFGLPAENYAIKTGTHPRVTTQENINNFRKQIKSLGFSYDWDREVDTTDPKYYKWTQWIFLKMFETGLAYEQDLPINYCPSCKTGLANEEVLNDFSCERCGTTVEKKKIRQWVLAITKYAERLLNDVDKLDWPEGIKDMQRNWIGKSEGCEFEMKKFGKGEKAVILHGRQRENRNYTSGTQNTRHWIPWLKSELESTGFDVYTPLVENDWEVKYDNWKKTIEDLDKDINIDENTTLIGTSAGGAFWVRWLGESKRKIKKLILIAPVKTINKNHDNGFDTKNGFWDFEIDNSIKDRTKEIYVFVSNDKDFIVEDSKNYAKILGAKIVDLPNRGHFTVKDNPKNVEIPEILNYITKKISVYTTRIDTVFGMTYAVLAPDHKDIMEFITPEQKEACLDYIDAASKKSDQDRTADDKEKTGVFTGSYVVNPFNGKEVPLWIGDYVLGSYGTGAVMAVPAHDERDFAFAKKYDLPIVQSIAPIFYGSNNKDFLPIEGKEDNYKPGVQAFIENVKGDKILLLNWKKVDWTTIVTGGIENGEALQDTVVREIKEETGYTNIEIIKGPVSGKFNHYNPTKNCNVRGIGYGFHIKLKSDNQKTISKEENDKHSFYWEDNELIKDKLSFNGHKYMYEQFFEKETAFTDYGILVDSGDFTGLTSEEAKVKLTEFAEKNNFGTKKVNYKLRDWLFSRQRYWGEPIPLIHLEMDQVRSLPHISDISEATDNSLAYILKREPRDGESCVGTTCHGKVRELIINKKVFSKIYDGLYGKIVCDYKLPLELPEVENFEPAGDGNSPLATVPEFVNVKLADNLTGKRETNTMPQWGGSCWYYLRYMDPKNPDRLVDRSVADYWGEVDSYVGGAEHAVLHLLYARFWHKFLFDIGVVPTDEPFYRLRNQGLILAYSYQNAKGRLIANDIVEEKTSPQPSPQGEGVATKYFDKETGEELQKVVAKMSKSLKNVVNPDEIIEEYGADTLRLYEMYMADFKDSAPWDTKNIIGVRRFIEKAERLFTSEAKISTEDDNSTMKLVHKTIKKVGEDIENYKFNTAIATLMILVNNGLPKDENLAKEWKSIFVRLLNPFTPHLAEELWQRLGNTTSVFHASWPEYDAKMTVDDTITIAVQVLGKVRGTIEVSKDEDQASVLTKAKENADVAKWLEGKTLVKEIYVPGKIVNLVVK